jgi:predicted MFS family arabinose efflux permease
LAVYTGQLVPIIYDTLGDDVSDADKFQKSLMCMVALGFGEMIGGLFLGYIIDRWGNRKAAYCNMVMITL